MKFNDPFIFFLKKVRPSLFANAYAHSSPPSLMHVPEKNTENSSSNTPVCITQKYAKYTFDVTIIVLCFIGFLSNHRTIFVILILPEKIKYYYAQLHP